MLLLAREAEGKAEHSRLDQALRDRRVWLLGLVYFTIASGIYIVSFWLPSLIQRTGLSDPLLIGLIGALPYAVAVATMVAANAHADRVRERRWHTIVPAVFCGGGLVLTAAASAHPGWAVLGLTIAAAGASAAQASFWCIPAAFLGGEAAAGGIALVNSLGNVAGFLSTSVIGWTTKVARDPAAALYLFAFLVAVGSLLLLLIPAKVVDK